MTNRTKRFGGATLGILFALLLGCLIGYTLDDKPVMAEGNATTDHLAVFSEVLAHIQNKYVEEVDVEQLIDGAVNGMIATLDPHSSYMKKESYTELKVDTKGEFGGLGIQISVRDHKLVVISPIEDTPAFREGIKAGDQILKVDGEATQDMTVTEAVDKMRGPKGSDVTLTIVRDGEDSKPFDVVITRDIIKIKSVRAKMIEPGIGYLRVTQFQERTGIEAREKLDELRKESLQGLVLDLRNNPGGLLTAAVEVSELFLDDGKMVVYIQGRDGKRDEYYAHSADSGGDYPIVVLVNNGSASASEIVSGALQDLGRAVIVGTVTFGKGSVQTILPLSDESGLRLTTAKYYTPSGRSIQNTGITPDIVVEYSPDKDISKERKQALTREKDLDGHLPNPDAGTEPDSETEPEAKPEPKPKPETKSEAPTIGEVGGTADEPALTSEEEEYLRDNQLQEAVDLLKGWRILQGKQPLLVTAGG
ncbi:MAG: PDZ domain-containing protein [Nitrospirae bacterium]|nr:PDZ domain-containing protein [Nitrospirota bacterium]